MKLYGALVHAQGKLKIKELLAIIGHSRITKSNFSSNFISSTQEEKFLFVYFIFSSSVWRLLLNFCIVETVDCRVE